MKLEESLNTKMKRYGLCLQKALELWESEGYGCLGDATIAYARVREAWTRLISLDTTRAILRMHHVYLGS